MYESPYWVGWSAGSWGLSWGAHEVEENPALVPAGHWKHLFRAIRACETAAVTVKCRTKWNLRFPHAVVRLVVPADTHFTSGRSRSRAGGVCTPNIGATVSGSATFVVKTTTAKVRKPTIPARTSFVRAVAYVKSNIESPHCGACTERVWARGFGFGYVTVPKVVKNPTVEEMMAWV